MLKLSKNLGYTLPMLFVVCGEGKGMCNFKNLHKCKFVSRLLSMIIARDGAKLLAYCLDYNLETYFFYLVPTNRSFFVIYLDNDTVNNCFLQNGNDFGETYSDLEYVKTEVCD